VVAAQRDSDGSGCRYVVRPNRSLSWPATRLVFAGVALFSTSLVLVVSLAGAWLVAPFAGLEMLAFGAGLYLCARRSLQREVISIDPSIVAVERGRYRPAQRIEFARAWARVALRPSLQPDRSRLLIACGGRAVEVGACLREDERRRLAGDLRREFLAG